MCRPNTLKMISVNYILHNTNAQWRLATQHVVLDFRAATPCSVNNQDHPKCDRANAAYPFWPHRKDISSKTILLLPPYRLHLRARGIGRHIPKPARCQTGRGIEAPNHHGMSWRIWSVWLDLLKLHNPHCINTNTTRGFFRIIIHGNYIYIYTRI